MAELSRPSAEKDGRSGSLGNGVYVARVISHLDPSFMGSIEVTLLKDQNNTPGEDAETHIVKYASPFFGYTPLEFMGMNDGTNQTIDGFNDTQKSYGMWFVPPDIGVNVLVLFAIRLSSVEFHLKIMVQNRIISMLHNIHHHHCFGINL